MATGGKDRGAREARERSRVYQARQQLHADQAKRRRRDNVLASVVGGILILAVLGAQTAYFTVGPGAPVPAPSVSPSPSIAPTPSDSPSPTTEPTPTPTATS